MRARRWILCVLLVLGGPRVAAPAAADGGRVVTVGGERVPADEPAEAAASRLARAYLEGTIALGGVGRTQTRTRASLGAEVDVPRLTRWIEAARDPDAPLASADEVELRVPVSLDPSVARGWLEELKEERDRPSRDASLDPETGEVVPHVDGRALDVWATLDGLDQAMREGRESAAIVTETTRPRRTTEQLARANIGAVLGVFETPYNGSGDAAERTHNLRVSASKIDGLVLLPGEVFDYNEVVGERSLANGFKPATVIAGGELVDGVGGGACQIAGTLHAAAYFAGLDIVERHPHSRPSSYIKLGLDAAVSYPNITFRFRNDRDFPILVRVIVSGGWVRAELLGAERTERVSFLRRIDEFQAYDEREQDDPRLPSGVRVLAQRGVPGFSLTTFRLSTDVRTRLTRRQRSESSYPPTTQIWRVGTGGPAPADYEPPAGDTHGEYTADEYLVATQGPDVEGTPTVRRAGRTGTRGWTARVGMPPVE